jgi:hypothetical protein
VLRSQLTANPFPLALSAPGWASVFPEPSTMVISSSGNVEMTPLVEPADEAWRGNLSLGGQGRPLVR